MRLKKPLSIVFATLLLMSMAAVVTASSWPYPGAPFDIHPSQAMWVDPGNVTTLDIGEVFRVDVLVNITAPTPGGGTGMGGFQYGLIWNNTVLTAVEIQTHGDNIPAGDLLPGWVGAPIVGVNSTTVTAGLREHKYASADGHGLPSTGVASLCTYKFRVNWQPSQPAPDWKGLLDIDFAWTILVEVPTSLPIPHTQVDGEYWLHAIPLPKPKVEVDPAYVMGVYGENFTIDIIIPAAHPLFAAWDLCGWEAKLSYDTTVLDALECTEGAWFAGFAGPNGTYPICSINDTTGVIHMADLYLGAHTQPFGAGVLMTIKFNATSMYTVPPGIPPHLSAMDLFDVLLVNCASEPIELYGVNDGVYEEPYKVLGWALDCWTDPYRKLGGSGNWYYTDFTGEVQSYPGTNGVFDIINDPLTGDWVSTDPEEVIWVADVYEPQEFVKLYAKLTYNEWPEQNKIVAFEIYGPCNPYYNVSIIRTAITNASGIATINFTIPHPCDHLKDIIFGKWVCYQMAQVKDPWDPLRFKKVVDVILWEVGWKVELLAVEASNPYPGGEVEITIWYKNIALMPMHVCFTFTVFDTLLDPIGELVQPCDMIPPGVYCSPYYGNKTIWIEIPKWCHVGPCAHVAVNLFTALPMQCGLPYCPEVQDHFTITLPPP